MRISFAAESVEVSSGQRFRRIDDSAFPSLYQMLIWASNPEEYRIHAEKIRGLAKMGSAPDFPCLHPEWFSEESLQESEEDKIDATVCNFCGYFQQCEKANTEFYVDLVFSKREDAQQGNINFGKNLMRKAFEFDDPYSNVAFSDPFTGFSRRAGESRNLFVVSYDDMYETLADRFAGRNFASCVGYDLLTCQPLWPLDFILLNTVKDVETWDALLLRSDEHGNEIDSLSLSDEHFLSYYLQLRAVERSEEQIVLLKQELSQMATLVFSDETFSKLKHRPFTPNVDHPFKRGSTHGLHLLFRFFELMPSSLETSLFRDLFPHLLSVMQEVQKTSTIGERISNRERKQRLLPRFPAILFLPKASPSIMLDLPGCKIIDVINAEIDQPMLLFDGLDFDLGIVRGWNFA